MPSRPRVRAGFSLFLFALLALPQFASAAANHVVISEFATRGPTAATDEFVELYNPTSAPINIAGWHFQYKPATSSTWSDRAILPANTAIGPHGFFLIANQSYIGSVTPDYQSSAWGSGTGMADNGNIRIIDASSNVVDKVGFGTGNDPEGGSDAPNHGTSANNNSVERKALATSTADSLAAGGAHSLLGNGQDTDVNGSDFVTQTHGRNPQNSGSAPEPALSSGGNGTGRASISPNLVFTDDAIGALTISFAQDSARTVTNIATLVPDDWTWSHSPGDVGLTGSAFASAAVSVVGDTVFITGATLDPADSGTVILQNLTAPPTNEFSTFSTRTAVASGTLGPIVGSPKVRILELVPIVSVHVNDPSTGVPIAPFAIGSEATIRGVVTASFNGTQTNFFVQDGTAGLCVFNSSPPPFEILPGDSVTVTGSIVQFRGLTELQPDFTLLTQNDTGQPIPAPQVVTCADVNATFHGDGTEPNEGRLIRINGVTYNASASTITDASGTTDIFIPASFPTPPAQFDVVGIVKQFKPGTPAPGPPYTADYEIDPRTTDDIIAHPGPILLTTPYEDEIQPTSVTIHWTTDVASTSVVYYGLTAGLGDSVVDATPTTTHALTVPGLTSATVYSYQAGSADANGENFSPQALFSTASPPATTGVMNVYFNHSVNTAVATYHVANGNINPTTQLQPLLDNAKRSIDAAFYSLSGTPGTTLATALINAKNRGVHVRVICEYDNRTDAGFTQLQSAGVPLINDRFDPVNAGNGLMHNKFCVIDGRGGAPDSAWVWTGSWNPTDPGTNNDFQNSIEVQDQALANAYTLEVNEMWGSSTDTPNAAASKFGADKLDNTPHRFLIGGRKVESYFSPSDGANQHILTQIDAAQHSIGFELLTITRSDLANALIAQHNAGLKVRGDIDSDSDTGSQYATLVGAGVDVHLKSNASGLLHHKYAIFDAENGAGWDPVTLTGSHNWSTSAETQNNENTLIVHDADIANQYLQEFSARYYQFGGTDSIHVSAVGPIGPSTSARLFLAGNAPNPFRGHTLVTYSLPTRRPVALRLYDVTGREVKTLVNQTQAAGTYHYDLSVGALNAGMYFLRLESLGEKQQSKVLVLK